MFLNYFWFGPGTSEHALEIERSSFCRQVPTYPGSEIDETSEYSETLRERGMDSSILGVG